MILDGPRLDVREPALGQHRGHDAERILRGIVEYPAVEREVEAAMRDFLRVSLERDARSLDFLDEVRRG